MTSHAPCCRACTLTRHGTCIYRVVILEQFFSQSVASLREHSSLTLSSFIPHSSMKMPDSLLALRAPHIIQSPTTLLTLLHHFVQPYPVAVPDQKTVCLYADGGAYFDSEEGTWHYIVQQLDEGGKGRRLCVCVCVCVCACSCDSFSTCT